MDAQLREIGLAITDLRIAAREGRGDVEMLKERVAELEARVPALEEAAKRG